MGLFDHFPYTNVHELNLDWVLSMMKALEAEWEAFTAGNSLTFADPLQHDISKTYAKNTIVLDGDGNAYVSLQAVPVGVGLQNGDYWLMVFDYEAFIEKVNKNFTARYYRGSYRATAAMAIGDWLTVDDVLCKATAAIAYDDILEIGVNIEHFTLEDFIKAFMTSANQMIQQYKNDIDASELAYRQQLAQDIADTTASLQAQLNLAISGATVDSEVINARLGANGITYSTLGDAIRSQIAILDIFHDDNLHNIRTILGYSDYFYFDFVQGNITQGAGVDEDRIWACRTNFITFSQATDIIPFTSSAYNLQYFIYAADETFIEYHNINSTVHITDTTKKYRFRIRKIDGTQIDISYAKTLLQYTLPTGVFKSIPEIVYDFNNNDFALKEDTKVLHQNIDTILGYTLNKFNLIWENGAIALSTGVNENAKFAIRTPDFIKFTEPTIIHFDQDTSTYRSQYIVYDSNGNYVDYHNKSGDLLISGSDLNYLYRIRVALIDTSQTIDYDAAKTFITFTPQVFASIPEIINTVIPSNKPLYGKNIVCFGDSITGNPIDPYDYPYHLQELSGATVLNAGFGGTNMSNTDNRAALSFSSLIHCIATNNWTVPEGSGISITSATVSGNQWSNTGVNYVPDRINAIKSIDWSEVDYIVVFFGTNDWNDNIPLDNNNDKYDDSTYLGAFRKAVEELWTVYPNIKILPITPVYRWFTSTTDSDNTPKAISGLYLYQYAEALKQVSKEYHLHCLDFYYESGINRANRDNYFYSNDGTHPNADTMADFAAKINNELSYNIVI